MELKKEWKIKVSIESFPFIYLMVKYLTIQKKKKKRKYLTIISLFYCLLSFGGMRAKKKISNFFNERNLLCGFMHPHIWGSTSNHSFPLKCAFYKVPNRGIVGAHHSTSFISAHFCQSKQAHQRVKKKNSFYMNFQKLQHSYKALFG